MREMTSASNQLAASATNVGTSTTTKAPVSAVVLAKNEANDIAKCLNSLSWCDEVVVVDDGSTDATRDIAIQCGARVVQNRFESFARQRNWAMEHAELRNEWILHLDADEVSTKAFADAVSYAIRNRTADTTVAFALCRKTMFLGRWLRYSDGFPVWIMRLTRKGCVNFQDQGHGEVAIPASLNGIDRIKEPFLHFAFSKGIANWIDRHNRYSTAEAKLELQQHGSVNWRTLLVGGRAEKRASLRRLSRVMPLRPILRFIYQYVFKFGWLDGYPGLVYCCLISTYEGWIVLKRRELIASSDSR